MTTYARPGHDADWSFEIAGYTKGGRARLRLAYAGQQAGFIESGLPGVYNLENLIGVIAACHRIGLPLRDAATARCVPSGEMALPPASSSRASVSPGGAAMAN